MIGWLLPLPDAVTRAAEATATTVGGVVLGVFVALGAVGLAALSVILAKGVLRARHGLEMGRVDTRPVPASVVEL